MINLATPEIWLVCGSQHLYGPGPLEQVLPGPEQLDDGEGQVGESRRRSQAALHEKGIQRARIGSRANPG